MIPKSPITQLTAPSSFIMTYQKLQNIHKQVVVKIKLYTLDKSTNRNSRAEQTPIQQQSNWPQQQENKMLLLIFFFEIKLSDLASAEDCVQWLKMRTLFINRSEKSNGSWKWILKEENTVKRTGKSHRWLKKIWTSKTFLPQEDYSRNLKITRLT